MRLFTDTKVIKYSLDLFTSVEKSYKKVSKVLVSKNDNFQVYSRLCERDSEQSIMSIFEENFSSSTCSMLCGLLKHLQKNKSDIN